MKLSRLLALSSVILRVAALSHSAAAQKGEFVGMQQRDGTILRSFVAGPADSSAGVLVVHDYFGISDATRESVEHLGSLGYRALAVDLYGGKSAGTHEEAIRLMQALNRNATDKALQIWAFIN